MSSMDPKDHFRFKVYIIESPSQKDISDSREEGPALFHALKLANIDVEQYKVFNLNDLTTALANIGWDPKKDKNGLWIIPVIHFSLHGNQNEIGLTSGESLTWGELARKLKPINDSRFSLLTICMSVCKGAYAHKMAHQYEINTPYAALVGPKINIDWSDSLTAFITLYHHITQKYTPLYEAVDIMNIAAGLRDEFRCFSGGREHKKYQDKLLAKAWELIKNT